MRLRERLTGNRPKGRTVYTMQVDDELRAMMFKLLERERRRDFGREPTFAGIVRDLIRREAASL